MNPESFIDHELNQKGKAERFAYLNTLYVDLLELKRILVIQEPRRKFRIKLKRLLGFLGQIADHSMNEIDGGKNPIVPPIIENNTAENYTKSQSYTPGSILVSGISNLIFFQIQESNSDHYICQRGELKLDEKNEYVSQMDGNMNVKIYKARFSGLVFSNFSEFKDNLNSISESYEKRRKKMTLVIISELLDLITAKYIS